MEVIAQTNGGYLLQATQGELMEIINAVTGSKPDKINIGQKIPAIDYAGTIKKIKSLKEEYNFTNLISNAKSVYNTAMSLQKAVEDAASIGQ